MLKYILSIVLSVIFALCNAQERMYTDKERGGAENGYFGKVADALEVTPMGQLSYEIPIPTLPGTAGMKPTLSVSYSSSTKDGLLGYGTDLAGLSVISRAPSDIMHDGSCRAIDFTDYDHFTLDGQRLMRFYHSTSSETEYRTENNIFSRIVLHGKYTRPSGFTVRTKSGLRYEYVPVSVALGDASSDSTLFWVVTRVCDTAGNYYSVTYSGDAATNDFYPSRIDYTGNESAGLAPYASIRFEYMENAYSPTKFVSGVRVRKSRVLTSAVRTTYRYADALFHKTGRGLLGFRERTVTDEDTKTVTTTEYDAVKEKYIMVPVRSRTTVNGRTVAENQTEYRLSTDYQNNPVRREVFTCLPSSTTGRKYEYTTGNLTEEVTATHEYDKYGNETQVTVNDGIVQTTVSNTYTNDEESWILGRLTRSAVTKTNAHGVIAKESSFEYDKTTGLLLSETFLPEDKELGYRKTYCRDRFGNITTSVMSANDDSDMRITATGYDRRGRFVTSTINSLGFRETAEYDGATGNVVSSTDINGIVTALEYGTFGELHETATPTSRSLKTTGWSEGMAGAPQGALYFEWNKTTGAPYSLTFYDSLGRELRTVTQSVGGKEVFSDREYDKRGNVIKSSEPYFSGDAVYWNTYEYDDAGRLTGQTSPDGSTVSISYDGRKTVTADPTGSRTVKVMNMAGLLESVEDDSGTATRYAYDAEGKVVGIVGPGKTVSCAYDNAGNRTILYDPDTGQTEETYNGFGELMTHKDSHGTTTYEYDSAGRMTRETRPDMTVTTEYDKTWKGSVSRVSSVGNTRYAKTYTYDSYGRVTEENVTAGDRTFTVGTTYNGMGLVDIITYPSGMCVRNRYDACGTLTAVSDAGGNVTYWRLNTLDARGQAEKETLGNGLTTVTGHDARNGRLSAMQTPGVQNWEYAYDAVGNLTLRRDLRRGMAESFTYDNLHRLTGVAKNGVAAMTVTYDTAGNITKKTDIGNYVYEDGSNRLVTIKDCCRTLVDWDEVAYSSFDKVTMVKSGDRTMTIGYGADKSRVYSELQGVRRYYVGDLFELETGTDGKTKSRCYVYAFGKAVAQIVSETGKADAVVYMHHDHLGSIQAYTDESGRLLYELSYDAWGMKRNPNTWITSVLPTSERTCGDRGFTEHEHIDVFEMINMDGRMYDPMTGRFLSADPVVQAPESSQGLNRYAYCMNNPLSLVDPTGYSWFSKNWKALTASFVGIAVSVVTAGTGTGLSAALLAGAAGGAASALTGALLNGANIGQVAKTTFTGAFWGAASAAMNNSIGTIQNV